MDGEFECCINSRNLVSELIDALMDCDNTEEPMKLIANGKILDPNKTLE